MKNTSLQTYLHDHLAGAALAIDLLDTLGKRHADDCLGPFATSLLVEIKEDRAQLQALSGRIEQRSAGFKEMLARLLEKISRLKLQRSDTSALGTLESLETLALGILGKEALWTALAIVDDPRLSGVDYAKLAQRALEQHARVEQQRLKVAATALCERSAA